MAASRTTLRDAASGFTLIEMLAVVAIIALVIGIALPNLGLRSRRLMEDEAKSLAASLEFARQRSVMTGVPHRVVVDVEEGSYWLEALESEAEDSLEQDLDSASVASLGDPQAISMAPPAAAEQSYRSLPGGLGQTSRMPDGVRIDAIETPGGFLERGLVNIAFERDGTSEPADILLSIEEGHVIRLGIAPMADSVRISHETP